MEMGCPDVKREGLSVSRIISGVNGELKSRGLDCGGDWSLGR